MSDFRGTSVLALKLEPHPGQNSSISSPSRTSSTITSFAPTKGTVYRSGATFPFDVPQVGLAAESQSVMSRKVATTLSVRRTAQHDPPRPRAAPSATKAACYPNAVCRRALADGDPVVRWPQSGAQRRDAPNRSAILPIARQCGITASSLPLADDPPGPRVVLAVRTSSWRLAADPPIPQHHPSAWTAPERPASQTPPCPRCPSPVVCLPRASPFTASTPSSNEQRACLASAQVGRIGNHFAAACYDPRRPMPFQVLQRPDWHGTPIELGDLFRLQKNRREARAALFTHQLGWEVRLHVGSQLEVVQTRVCRDQQKVLWTGELRKAAMIEKGRT